MTLHVSHRPLAPLIAGLLIVTAPRLAGAQSAPLPDVLRGVPAAPSTGAPIQLSLADAIHRGLEHNLAAVLQEQRGRTAESDRLRALAEVLPHISGTARESRQVLSTAAFGFTGFPGIPTVLGPFNVFDARLNVSAPLFDARVINGLRATTALTRASEADAREVREVIVLAVGNLYLQAQADASRVASARGQAETAATLVQLAEDQRASGLVAGIDVLRQQVALQSARARVIAAENALAKRLLSLGRAIGLPATQPIVLTDSPGFHAAPAVAIDQAVEQALAARDDLKAARARADAARAALHAEAAGHLPSLHLDADVGVLGSDPTTTDKTYAIAVNVHVPIFDGGATRARVLRADADLRAREAELADLTSGVRSEVQAALLDVDAAAAGVGVAESAQSLARQALEQAQDRFRAGVSSTVELVQAQDALAAAADQYIAGVYAHNIAKAALARALGGLEARFVSLVGGQPQ
jgi:outer membrane protein TolC